MFYNFHIYNSLKNLRNNLKNSNYYPQLMSNLKIYYFYYNYYYEAISYDQLKMTDLVLCKMTNLYFEDDQPEVTKSKIAFKQWGKCF